mmetsp:Transcript_83092/g.144326  ORF Transcript_83092/g.144326 Transcript_83092/m.144326 type:complete len:210 (+) Transcript_83092:98-727(+)
MAHSVVSSRHSSTPTLGGPRLVQSSSPMRRAPREDRVLDQQIKFASPGSARHRARTKDSPGLPRPSTGPESTSTVSTSSASAPLRNASRDGAAGAAHGGSPSVAWGSARSSPRPSSSPGLDANLTLRPQDIESWREALASLQSEYTEVLRGIDARAGERIATLRTQLENSRSYDMPPSYPPSDVESTACSGAERSSSNADVVETDPESF